MNRTALATLPARWAPFEAQTVNLGRPEHDDTAPDATEAQDYTGSMVEALEDMADLLRAMTDTPHLGLNIRQSKTNKRGFCTGRVNGRRIVVTLCPNADLAEAYATLVHEFAHAWHGVGHCLQFKQDLVTLASEIWGANYFEHVDTSLPYHKVDSLVTSGIRAAENEQAPPQLRTGEPERQGQTIRRVLKMRRLAEKHPGTPEAISATAIANDLVALWDLGHVTADISGEVEDALCDEWVFIGKRQKWLRSLMWAVCGYFDVYALSQSGQGTMHLFGKHTAVMAALHLFEVAKAHIERRLAEHFEQWEAEGRPNGAHKRTEGTNFKYSAARALRWKLQDMAKEDKQADEAAPSGTTALVSYSQKDAEAFAYEAYERLHGRKMRVSTEKSASYSYSAAGAAAGRSVPMGQGVGGGNNKGLLA